MPRLELTLLQPDAPPSALTFDKPVVTMGRSTDCAIPIDDRFLSRKHAEIVSEAGEWVLRDNGSANGTFVNGTRIQAPVRVRPGDRIQLGNTELVIGGGASAGFPSAPAPAFSPALSPYTRPPVLPDLPTREEAAPLTQFILTESQMKESAERSRIIHRLALELIADRPLEELFDFILDRVVEVMQPSRAALALLTPDGQSANVVKMRRTVPDTRELSISRTLLREVVRDRKVLAFTDIGSSSALAAAESIVAQSIYSALCAPMIAGDTVVGVLYVDFQMSRRVITEDDAQLAAQIARVAALKVESTRLREAALEKGKLDETLKLAQAIQMRMLPQELPTLTADSAFDIAAALRPAKTVGGDFYDFYATADARVYFCIGDVSGKGVPAALMMAVSRALFRSFILAGRDPADIMSAVNRQLCDETDEAMFVTVFCGVLDLRTGQIRYSNGGHNPPIVIGADGSVRSLPTRTGLVLGHLPGFKYTEEASTLLPGDVLYLYTDGISEATNARDEEFSVERLEGVLRQCAAKDVRAIANGTLSAVEEFVGEAPQSDDLTLLCIRYLKSPI